MALACGKSNLTNLDKAAPNNYQLIFPALPTEDSISANNPFVLNIFSAVIPSVSIAEEELRWQSNKTKRGLIPMEFDAWLVNFVVDSNFENWKLLFTWMSYINNNWNKIAEEHKNYAVDASLVITNNYRRPVLNIVFVDIWPNNIGEVSLSQREGDIQLECIVNFTYDYFYIRD
jgi:hypothetical protein